MGMSSEGGKAKVARAVPYINVTPLIDVLLVLLIIFMVVTPLKPKRFRTLIPEQQQGDSQATAVQNTMLRVDIQKDNKLQLFHDREGQMVSDPIGSVDETNRLSATLAQTFQMREQNRIYKFGTTEVDKTVFIKAPKDYPYGEVVKVIDAVKGGGAEPVGLQVDALDQ